MHVHVQVLVYTAAKDWRTRRDISSANAFRLVETALCEKKPNVRHQVSKLFASRSLFRRGERLSITLELFAGEG